MHTVLFVDWSVNNNNYNNDNYDDGVVIMAKVIARVTRFIWWMQTERRVAAKPQTKPIDLGCESASRLLLSTSTVDIVIITQPVSWYSFCRPTERGMLSWPRHCSKSSQPVPKAVYRSGRRDKHNHRRCDSSPSALTPKSVALAVAQKLHGV